MKSVKTLAIGMGVVIVILLGVLLFVPAAKGPTVPPAPGPAAAATSTTSADGTLQVVMPQPGAVVASPVAIEGAVTGGGWYFEGTFPIQVLDGTGKVIGSGTAQSLGDWMSTATVPFAASISFTTPGTATGTIVFSKDNPSGLPRNAGSLSVPVAFR
ncbi:MAG TPA: Gmad2 immunoglobulin-like domain-containing protein [Candidatus Paceibacterota bacterium]|nr:Gmad2 immunoglobulin-like domain-containing protein [Candidatus Paceibacterota bacterium]